MKKKLSLTTTHIIMLSFLGMILLGSLILSLPTSAADGNSVPYLDALFTATTSVCVTGLVTLPTASTWSIFGQVVILLLIQIGGLGVITTVSAVIILLHKRMGISNRLLLQDTFNLNSLSGIIRFVKRVMAGTFLVEGVGALLYMLVFIPRFGRRSNWIVQVILSSFPRQNWESSWWSIIITPISSCASFREIMPGIFTGRSSKITGSVK